MQRSLEVSLGCMPNAPPNPLLIKQREAYWCYFSVVRGCPISPWKLSADALAYMAMLVESVRSNLNPNRIKLCNNNKTFS